MLSGDITGSQFVDRALRVGRDLRDRPLVVVAFCKDDASDDGEAQLERLLLPLQVPSVLADLGEHVMGVVGLAKTTNDEALIAHFQANGARAGVSRSVDVADLSEATRQARAAAKVAVVQQRPATLHFDRLGVMRLLVSLAHGPELRMYVNDELGLLMQHDMSDVNQLLPTLRAYLDSDGNKSRAADLLCVQRRTLYYRLERIEALLGRSVEDAEIRAELNLAFRVLDFLKN